MLGILSPTYKVHLLFYVIFYFLLSLFLCIFFCGILSFLWKKNTQKKHCLCFRQTAFLPKNGGRPGATKVLVVVTDGESADGHKGQEVIGRCNRDGIIRFGIAVSERSVWKYKIRYDTIIQHFSSVVLYKFKWEVKYNKKLDS